MYSSPMLDFREFLQVHGLGKQLAWLKKRIGDSSTFNLGFADNILCSWKSGSLLCWRAMVRKWLARESGSADDCHRWEEERSPCGSRMHVATLGGFKRRGWNIQKDLEMAESHAGWEPHIHVALGMVMEARESPRQGRPGRWSPSRTSGRTVWNKTLGWGYDLEKHRRTQERALRTWSRR